MGKLKWSKELIKNKLIELDKRKINLDYHSLMEDSSENLSLYIAAGRRFGSWKNAVLNTFNDYEVLYQIEDVSLQTLEEYPSVRIVDIDEKKWCGFIYITTNLINDKKYIGQSIFKKSWKRYLGSGKYLKNAINKYGKENFKREIIELCETREKLNEREKYWIIYFDAHNPNNDKFYNIAEGGNGDTFSGLPEFEKERIRKISSERAKLSTGLKNPNYGNRGVNNPLSKRIAQIDTTDYKVIKVWDASIEIQRNLGFHGGNICKTSLLFEKENTLRSSNGYYWCYEKDIINIPNAKLYSPKSKNKVRQIDLETNEIIREYDSLKDAGDFIGVNPENISRVCRGKNKSSGGYKWEFIEENRSKTNFENNYGDKNHMARSIVQLSINGYYVKTFRTIKEASEITKTSINSLYANLNRGNAKHVSNGFRWVYSDDYENMKDEEKQKMIEYYSNRKHKAFSRIGCANPSSKNVFQLTMECEFIKEYESVSDASSKTGVNNSSISACCRKVYKTAGGFKWMYEEDYEKLIEQQNSKIS